MTTKARIAALQWFHDRGEANIVTDLEGRPTWLMLHRMFASGQISDGSNGHTYSLTDKGRQDLHEATK